MVKPKLPPNFNNPPKRVRHDSLERYDMAAFISGTRTRSNLRSSCPVCEDGVLAIYRDVETLRLLAEDRCSSCGQQFIYTDIQELRACDGMG